MYLRTDVDCLSVRVMICVKGIHAENSHTCRTFAYMPNIRIHAPNVPNSHTCRKCPQFTYMPKTHVYMPKMSKIHIHAENAPNSHSCRKCSKCAYMMRKCPTFACHTCRTFTHRFVLSLIKQSRHILTPSLCV